MKKILEILKKAEQCRFEAAVDADLLRRSYECHPDLKLPAKIQLIKQDAMEKEEHAGGEYDVDLLKSSSWSQQVLTRQSLKILINFNQQKRNLSSIFTLH